MSPLYYLRNYLVVLILWCCAAPRSPKKLWDEMQQVTWTRVLTVATLFVLSIAYVIGSDSHPFLYFNF